MSKGDKRRGSREAKKPKKVKEKVVATANFTNGASAMKVTQKKK